MNKYYFYLEKLKIDKKKDLIRMALTITIIVSLSIYMFLLKKHLYSISLIGVAFIYIYSHFLVIKSKYESLLKAKEIAFNGFYRYLINLLKNGNVLFQSLKMSIDYVDEVLVDDINELVDLLENENSIRPFIEFSKNFNDENIKQLILLLFEIDQNGSGNNVLSNASDCILKLQDDAINEYCKIESSKIEKNNFIPLLLSASIIIVVTLYIFSKVGSI